MCKFCDAGIPTKPFRLTAQFPEGRRSDGYCRRGWSQIIRAASRRSGRRRPAQRHRQARPALCHSRRFGNVDGPAGRRLHRAPTCWSRASKILAVGPNLHAGGASEIDARGRIVMPGFIDTHHHQFETALRSFLADGVLINDGSGSASGSTTYFEYILLKFAPVYTPAGRLHQRAVRRTVSQLDDGVTTVHDVSQIHHSPQHSDAAIQALFDTGRRAAFGYFESAGAKGCRHHSRQQLSAGRVPHQETVVPRRSSNGLVHMIMGGEVYLGDSATEESWKIGRQLGSRSPRTSSRRSASARSWTPSRRARAAQSADIGIGADNLFIHMTGHVGHGVEGESATRRTGLDRLPDRDEHASRHAADRRMQTMSTPRARRSSRRSRSTSSARLTADFFTQMRSAMNLQRMIVNQMILDSPNGNQNLPRPAELGASAIRGTVPGAFPYWPTPPVAVPAPLTTRDVLRYATMNGAKALRLDGKVGSLTPGQGGRHHHSRRHPHQRGAAQPGARRGRLADGPHQRRDRDRRRQDPQVEGSAARRRSARLRRQLEASRDYIFKAAGIKRSTTCICGATIRMFPPISSRCRTCLISFCRTARLPATITRPSSRILRPTF